jgi:hypothetical protein
MTLFEPTIPNSHSATIASGQGVASPANWRLDQSGLSVNINKNFPLKGKNITAKQNFIA